MQGGDVGETDNTFTIGRFKIYDLVNDALETIAASRAKNHIYRGICEGILQVRQSFFIRSAKPSVFTASMDTFRDRVTPTAKTLRGTFDVVRVDGSGRRNYSDRPLR